jgi:DNA polymerase I-like protein with 3'-5' exonuclease and polymerase domains/uracil-DNA glycosylase
MTQPGNPNRIALKRLTMESPRSDSFRHPMHGTRGAPILVLCDPPSAEAHRAGLPTSMDNLKTFAQAAFSVGLAKEDFMFLGLCTPIAAEDYSSASRKWKHVEAFQESVLAQIEALGSKVIVGVGELATRVLMGRAVAITKARGSIVEVDGRLVMPMLSPGFINKVPEHAPTFQADMLTLAQLKQRGFKQDSTIRFDEHYRWCEDVQFLVDMHPAVIAVDTETTGLTWHDPSVKVLTVQIAWAPGRAIACPIDIDYWPAWQGRGRARARLFAQLKALLEDPTVRKVGHNLKFDLHMSRKLGIDVKGWTDDTQLMAWAVDENMMSFGLDDAVRRWVPSMAGYSDEFDRTIDKAKMAEVPHEVMLPYAAGDADAAFRLWMALDHLLQRDLKQYTCYRRILMPAIATFGDVIERHGMLIDVERLRQFETEVEAWVEQEFRELIAKVPRKIRLRYLERGEPMAFSKTKFVKEILFTADGFDLTPVVYTKTTAALPEDQREPSTSAKDHLPYFVDRDDAAGEFVRRLIDFQKTQKLLGTYIQGFYKYLAPNGRIYPSYMLHRTVTGRTASADPNGQNFPKRGRWAKSYQKIFQATPGWKLVNCDLSQIELRIAAWMANDPAMIEIYRQNGDIHTATAKATAQLSDEQWDALSGADRKLLRTKAKSVNFGFLYGMGAKKFRSFAKTDYNVDYSEREAETTRRLFFQKYARLPAWHDRMREMADRHKQVRALHGAIRHLPSIDSNDEITRGGAQRMAINSPVQRFGSDLGLMAMVRFSRQADPDKFRLIGFVHDALVLEVRDGFEQEGIEALLWAMGNPPLKRWFGIEPPLPILAEAEIGLNMGELLEFADLPAVEKRPQWFQDMGFDRVEPRKPAWWNDQQERLDDQAIHALMGASEILIRNA